MNHVDRLLTRQFVRSHTACGMGWLALYTERTRQGIEGPRSTSFSGCMHEYCRFVSRRRKRLNCVDISEIVKSKRIRLVAVKNPINILQVLLATGSLKREVIPLTFLPSLHSPRTHTRITNSTDSTVLRQRSVCEKDPIGNYILHLN